MHLLGTVLIRFDTACATIRPLAARDAAAQAQLDTLLFRYEQPAERMWGVEHARGFKFDWCVIGGRFNGWGRGIRGLMSKQRIHPTQRRIPRFLERNATWSEDLARVRLSAALCPLAIVTPYGDWIEAPAILPTFGKTSVRARRAQATWLKKIRQVARVFPDCLAVGVDYHC